MSNKTVSYFAPGFFVRGLIILLLAMSGLSNAYAQSRGGNLLPSTSLPPENELLLDVRVDDRSVNLTILAYQMDDRVLVALSELMSAIEFPVNVDAGQGLAGGWFIAEEREFSLDLSAGRVLSDGRTFGTGNAVVASGGELFVTVDALEQWFPLDLQPDIRTLSLNVVPKERIPLQDKLDRRNRRPQSSLAINREASLPLQPTPYRFLGPHAADVRLNTSTTRDNSDPDANTDLSGSYSVLARGDLLWMTSTMAFSGRDDDEVTGGRFKLERDSLDAPLALDYVEVGDVDTGSRGVLVRGGGAREGMNTGLFSDEQVDLRGDIPTDWEVELYRNGILIDFQVVGSDAQYEFLDVPLVFGENVFEFVFYGPFGEEERKQQVFYAGRNDLDFGEVSYELSAVQNGRTVTDINEGNTKGDVGAGRYLGALNVGLFSGLSLRLGADSFVSDDDRLEDYRASLSANLSTLQLNAGYRWLARDLDQAAASISARLGQSTTSQLRYTEYLDGTVEPEYADDDPRLWRAGFTLTSQLLSVPYTLNADHNEREQSSGSTASLGTTVRVFDNDRFSTSLNYSRSEDAAEDESIDESVRGAFSFSTQFRPWSLRVGADYTFSPQTEFNSVFASTDLRIDDRMSMNLDVDHTVTSDYTSYRMGLNWQLEHFIISPQVIYDSNERWVGLISLSTSLGTAPDRLTPTFSRFSQTGFGNVKSRVFVDDDGDGVLSRGDQLVSGARVKALQSWREAETDSDGNAYLSRLSPDRRTDIVLDPTSIDDLDLEPATQSVSVEPRAASWSYVDFPMVRASELEGHVYYIPTPGAEPLPQSRALVELVDAKGEVVSRQRAAFDGFYLFSSVTPGRYRVRVGGESAEFVRRAPPAVEVTADGGVIRDLDFIIESWRQGSLQNSIVPASEAPDEGRQRDGFAPASSTPIVPTSTGTPEPEVISAPLAEEIGDNAEPVSPAPDETVEPEPITPVGDWYVQLGAFGEINNAENLWDTLLRQGLLASDRSPVYESSGGLTRLLVGPGVTEAEARSLCGALKEQGRDCLVKQR